MQAMALWADVTLGESDVADPADLAKRRGDVREEIIASLGERPRNGTPELIRREVRAETPGYRLEHVRYSLSDGDVGVALVALPPTEPRGIIAALHQTTDAGMLEVMGLGGMPGLAYGDAFARAGYMVIAPEVFTVGERTTPDQNWNTAAFYEAHPNWSAMGKMLSDHEDAVTIAQELFQETYGGPAPCIAAVGHSLGAHNALMLAALDDRIDAVVSNGGFERIVSDNEPTRWSRDGGFIYIPALHDGTRRIAPLPWDWEDVVMQIYPRSAFIVQGLSDAAFTHEISVAQVGQAVESVYRAGGHAERFDTEIWFGGHAFPAQERAIGWVTEQCQERGVVSRPNLIMR